MIRFLVPVAFASLAACGRGDAPVSPVDQERLVSFEAPHDDVERAVLAAVADTDDGESLTVSGATATRGTSYAAASGRTCVRIDIQIQLKVQEDSGRRTRLACERDGTWTYVPNVFAGSPEAPR